MIVTMDMLTGSRKSGQKPGEYNCVCPSCGENTFYYNIYSKKYICFRENCRISGKFADSDDEDIIITDKSLIELKKSLLNLYTIQEEIHEINLDRFSDPLNEETKKKYIFGYEYIRKRGLTDEDIERYRIRIGKEYFDKENEKTERKWCGRVIFPFYDSGVPIYAIGRSYNNSLPKYLNTDGEKSIIVYNLDQIKDNTCIVCEGLISSIFAEKHSGISAVCLLGCSMSDSQFWQIRNSSSKIFCCLDGGVDQTSICRRFLLSGAETYQVDLPVVKDNEGKEKGLDPAECSREQFLSCINNAKRFTLI